MTTTATSVRSKRPSLNTLAFLLAPVLLLAGVIALFVFTKGAGLNVTPPCRSRICSLNGQSCDPDKSSFTCATLAPRKSASPKSTSTKQHGPTPFLQSPGIPPLGTAVILLNYPWVQAEAYEITVFSSNQFRSTRRSQWRRRLLRHLQTTLWSFTMIGIYVGIIPVVLGMFWLPALKRVGPRAMTFLMSATVGLLVYLGIDATTEALEIGGKLGGAFQGTGIVGIGIVGTFLLLDAVGRQQEEALGGVKLANGWHWR